MSLTRDVNESDCWHVFGLTSNPLKPLFFLNTFHPKVFQECSRILLLLRGQPPPYRAPHFEAYDVESVARRSFVALFIHSPLFQRRYRHHIRGTSARPRGVDNNEDFRHIHLQHVICLAGHDFTRRHQPTDGGLVHPRRPSIRLRGLCDTEVYLTEPQYR